MSSMAKGSRGFVNRILWTNQKSLSRYGFVKFIILTVLVQIIIIEGIQRADIYSLFLWISDNPLIFLLNCVLLCLFLLFFVFLTGTLRWSVVLSFFVMIFLSLANLVKKQLLGEPLFPSDFTRLDQVINLIPQYKNEFILILIILVVLVIVLFFAGRYLIPNNKIKWTTRAVIFLIVLALIPTAIFYRHTPFQDALKNEGIEHIYWQQTENSIINGFIMGFIMNIEDTLVFAPGAYTHDAIKNIIDENSSAVKTMTAKTEDTQVKPDIIVVLDESFWDPTILPGITFSEDPLPYFRELGKSADSKIMVSPVFGGSTANVEFELLTGLSTNFLPPGAIAYQNYIENSLPALPDLLKSQGYSTVAIHPYHDWFYKRDKVYPLLGFEEFYSLVDFENTQKTGEYIGDMEVSRKIISELQDEDKPKFIFAITMQNHGPYPADRYKNNDVTVSGNLTAEGKAILETYTQGVHDADKSLKYLIDSISNSNRPTIVVCFGDHLPYLGKDYQVYRETGFINGNDNEWTLEDKLKMKSVPLLIWSNYQNFSNDTGSPSLSPSLLGSYLLDRAGLNKNFVFSFTENLSRKISVFDKQVIVDTDNTISDHIPDNLAKYKNDYWLLEYDLLFGEKYYLEINE